MRNANDYQTEIERNWKNRMNRNMNISSIESVNRKLKKFHVLVVQNNGKEMYKKVYWTC